MDERTERDNRTLLEFWSGAFAMTDEEMEAARNGETPDYAEFAPSQKLYDAACTLGMRKNVLDYGCGNAWAAVIAAKSGCQNVTAADAAPGAVRAARFCAELFGVENSVRCIEITEDWLASIPDGEFDGVICSNVLDVVPPETADGIISLLARAAAKDASVIVGLNYYLSPEAAEAKGEALEDGRRLYVDGVLRLVSRTDEEWAELFAPYFEVERLEHFAWPGEAEERRRLFYLRRR